MVSESNCLDFPIKTLSVSFFSSGSDTCTDEEDEAEDIDDLRTGEGDRLPGGDGDLLAGSGDGDFLFGSGEGDFLFSTGDGDLSVGRDFFATMIFSGVLDLELDLDELDDELKIKGPSWIHKKNMFVNPPPSR